MAKLLPPARLWIRTAGGLAVTASLLLCSLGAHAQHVLPHALFASKKKQGSPERPPVRATLQPSLTIPAEPLGFTPPAEFYLGARNSLVSLDFLDEDRLLFTFRVPGLIHRAGRTDQSENERKIRAVVLHLPGGSVESEAVWTLHDRERYLYTIGNGQFLLRDGDTLQLGDASLQLKPYLRFPGPILWVEMDPSRQFLVTGSTEPPTQASRPGDVPSPNTARASLVADTPNRAEKRDMVVRILRRDDGKVMLVSHVNSAVHLPINSEGYLETLRGNGAAWKLNLNYFTGGSRIIGSVESACVPLLNFISPGEFLATTCNSSGDPKLVAMGLNGKRLWENPSPGPSVWPILVTNDNGARIARESLVANHTVNAIAPLEAEDIKGQDVQILDATTGKQVLRAAASPFFDAGGNVAISPSARRVAIMMDGNLQVFDLPAPPAAMDVSTKH
jgi:hypothetical protein